MIHSHIWVNNPFLQFVIAFKGNYIFELHCKSSYIFFKYTWVVKIIYYLFTDTWRMRRGWVPSHLTILPAVHAGDILRPRLYFPLWRKRHFSQSGSNHLLHTRSQTRWPLSFWDQVDLTNKRCSTQASMNSMYSFSCWRVNILWAVSRRWLAQNDCQ